MVSFMLINFIEFIAVLQNRLAQIIKINYLCNDKEEGYIIWFSRHPISLQWEKATWCLKGLMLLDDLQAWDFGVSLRLKECQTIKFTFGLVLRDPQP